MPEMWTAVQSCVWIGTRNETLVLTLDLKTTRFEAGYIAFPGDPRSKSAKKPSPKLAAEIARREEVWGAARELENACRRGDLTMHGLAFGVGDPAPISQLAWSSGLTLQDRIDSGVVAASSDPLNKRATWWGKLTVERDKIRALWKARRVQHSTVAVENAFSTWAKQQSGVITQTKAYAAMVKVLPGLSREAVRRLVKALPAERRADRGRPAAK
jgi:hypothetical protein